MGLRTLRRRRREALTNYKLRKNLLKSGIPRIVIRRTNKYFIVQAVRSNQAQDEVVESVSSKDLLKKGWDKKMSGSLKSIPAGFLTGMLLAKKLGKGKYIVDLGLSRTGKGSRVFSVVKGLIEGGLDISADKKVFPTEERLKGSHLKEGTTKMIEEVRSKI
jgi:large subunit ribosomal protein L18